MNKPWGYMRLLTCCYVFFLSICDGSAKDASYVSLMKQSDVAWNSFKVQSNKNDILDFIEELSRTIRYTDNGQKREEAIKIFNMAVSTGLREEEGGGIDLNPPKDRLNRLYEIVVNKVARHMTESRIWESHKILNKIPVHDAFGKNQWRLLKRIYRQVNDPRFWWRHGTDAATAPIKQELSSYGYTSNFPPNDYATLIADTVLEEAGDGKGKGKGAYITPSGKKITFGASPQAYRVVVTPDQSNPAIQYRIVSHNGKFEDHKLPQKPLQSDSAIRVLHTDTYEAAQEMMIEDPNAKVAVVDFANERDIGGGFLHGSGAQEEELCRRSNLFSQLTAYGKDIRHYRRKIDEHGTIVVPQTTVYKGRDFENLEDPYDVGVIVSAAMDLKHYNHLSQDVPTRQKHPAVINTMREKIRSQIASAVQMKADVLVLGAFGAGAFLHDPIVISDLYAEELKNFGGYFKKIVFAIISPYRDNNYKFFRKNLYKHFPHLLVYDLDEPQTFFIVPDKTRKDGVLDPSLNLSDAQELAKDKLHKDFKRLQLLRGS